MSILAPAQAALGADVHIGYISPGAHLRALEQGGVRLHHIPARGNHDPRIAGQLWSLMGRVRPDIVHSWIPQMDIAAGVVALSRRIPWVMSERSASPAYSTRFKDRVVRRAVGRWASAVVANSQAGYSLWQRQLRRGGRVHVVRNALPLESIDRAPPATLETFGVARGQRTVIFVGRLSYEKNISLLLSVATELCEKPDVVFLICGEGPERPQLEQAIRTLPVGDRIRILGYQPEIWRLMKASHALVSTSTFEGHPNAVLEAMACRCPIVVSDIAAHREFLGRGTAEIVPLRKEDFVAAIDRVLAGGEEVQERIEAARLDVEGSSPETAALAYSAIYRETSRRRNRCVA